MGEPNTEALIAIEIAMLILAIGFVLWYFFISKVMK